MFPHLTLINATASKSLPMPPGPMQCGGPQWEAACTDSTVPQPAKCPVDSHLYQPGAEGVINYDVKAIQLKAVPVVDHNLQDTQQGGRMCRRVVLATLHQLQAVALVLGFPASCAVHSHGQCSNACLQILYTLQFHNYSTDQHSPGTASSPMRAMHSCHSPAALP